MDIYAPGAGILVNAPLFGTQIESGSSLACAQVSAAASLLWEKDRTRDAEFIRRLMEETANVGIDPEYGKGLLDVEQAIEEFDAFVPGEKEEAGEEKVQEKPLLEFDEGEIKALWKDSDHQKMVQRNSSDEYRLMYRAAAYPDEGTENTNLLKKDKRFHGSKNYLATLKFLVNLAHEYYMKDKDNPEKICTWAKNNSQLQPNTQGDIVYNVRQYVNRTIFPELGIREDYRRNKAYKLMGLVVHVAGDVYAHRARVTSAMLNNARDRGSSSEAYEDNVNVENWRYSDARKVVSDLINKGASRDFRSYGWNQNVLRDLDRLCGKKDSER